MISSVSTTLCSSAMPASAVRMRRWPSKWNGFVITATGGVATSRAGLAIHRRGAGAGAAAHAGGDEHHVGAREMITNLVDDFLCCGSADVRLRTGAEAL